MNALHAFDEALSHPISAVVRLRLARKVLWIRELWRSAPDVRHPSAIGDAEVDQILAISATSREREVAFYSANTGAFDLGRRIDEAEAVLWDHDRWLRVVRNLRLTRGEAHLLLLAVAVAVEPALGRVYAYLHDQPELTQASAWLAAATFGELSVPVLSPTSSLLSWRLLRPAPEVFAVPEAWRAWVADPAIVAWLVGETELHLPRGADLQSPDEFAEYPLLYPEALAEIQRFTSVLRSAEARKNAPWGPYAMEVELVGAPGSGRRVLAGRFAASAGEHLLMVDAARLLANVPESEVPDRILDVVRASVLQGVVLFWRDDEAGRGILHRDLLRRAGFWITARTDAAPAWESPGLVRRSLELRPLTLRARESLWARVGDGPPPRQLREWALTPGEITKLVAVRDAGDEAIQQAFRRPSESLELLAKLPLPFDADDLVLPESVAEELLDFERQIRLRWTVYEDLGFERLCPNGRGVVGLFAGPSGTGKTMAAQVLARKLGMELYRLDPAQVVNKYIGETEKRLKTVLDECDRAHFLLLIDECEGMFGQRFNSKDAHDRYANLEIDFLLQRLERFQGVAILATNRKDDIDGAFLRRLRTVIDFVPPGPSERIRIWQNAIPEAAPNGAVLRGEIDWDRLARKADLTGAEIKLAALNAAFLACARGGPIGMAELTTAIRREMAKRGETLRGFE